MQFLINFLVSVSGILGIISVDDMEVVAKGLEIVFGDNVVLLRKLENIRRNLLHLIEAQARFTSLYRSLLKQIFRKHPPLQTVLTNVITYRM